MSDVEILGIVKTSATAHTQQYDDLNKKEQLTNISIKESDSSSETTLNGKQESASRAQLEEDISLLNDIGSSQPPALKFSIDDVTGKTVVQMLDRETDEVLRQIPGEDFMAIARIIRENGESLSDRPGQWVELSA